MTKLSLERRCILLLLLFIIPLYGLFLAYMLNTIHYEQKRLESTFLQEASQLPKNFDYELTRLENISLSVQNSRNIREYNYNAKEVSLSVKQSIISEIASLCDTNDFVNEIVVCLKSSQSAYSSTGLYSLNSLVPNVYPFSSWSHTQFVYDVNTVKAPVWRGEERIIDRGNYLSLLYPIPTQNEHPYALILYLISKQDFEHRVFPSFSWNVSIQVLSSGGDLIFSSSSSPLPRPDFQQVRPEQLFLADNNRGQPCTGVYTVSAKNGFRFLVSVTDRELFGSLPSPAAFWSIQLCIVLVLLGISFALSWLICSPVRNWLQKACGLYHISDNGYRCIPTLFRLLEKSCIETASLQQHIQDYSKAYQDHLFNEIFYGKYLNISAVNSLIRDSDIRPFECPHYFIVRMQFSESTDTPQNLHTIELLESNRAKWLDENYECHLKDSFLPGIIFILIGCHNSDSDTLKRDLGRMRERMGILLERDILFCVGHVCNELEGIEFSLLESCSLLRYQSIFGSHTVLMSSLLSSVHIYPKIYPSGLIYGLEKAFRSMDREQIANATQVLVSQLRATPYPPEIVSCILSDAVFTIIKADPAWFWDPDQGRPSESFYRIISLHTIEEVQEAILKIADSLDDPLVQSEKSSIEIAQIYRYINEHYCDYDFSIQGMSEHFGVSPSNMTHIFKRSGNSTIIEYVNKLRIERASYLLLSSDMTLKSIVKSIGFSDTSTFIKRFRNYYEMTPGQFKEKYREGAPSDKQ